MIPLPTSEQVVAVYATPEFAFELFKSGMTRKQIAHELGVSYDRVKRWIQRQGRRRVQQRIRGSVKRPW